RSARTGLINGSPSRLSGPRGLTPAFLSVPNGTGEAVPCPKPIVRPALSARSQEPKVKSFMSQNQFVHLHLHSDYSLLDGACDVEKLVDRVQKLGMPAVAMTDHGNIFGAVHFVNAAHKAGVKPIVGCELYICKKDD